MAPALAHKWFTSLVILQARDHRVITAAGDYTVCVWHTKKLTTTVSYKQPAKDFMMLLTITFAMQDNDSGIMEEEDTDYVDIPIKVVTQSNVAVS